MKYSLISVDLQNDFASEGGKHYTQKPSVNFLKKIMFPYLQHKGLRISEIISDYRQPRPGDRDESCVPGTWGYESIVPAELVKARWIKCMNSPLWTRKNIGDPTKKPGLPYQNPEMLGRWLGRNIGEPGKVKPVVFGLTIDCCVLSTVQELSWRGYYPLILKEGVDHYTGKLNDKTRVIRSAANNWANVVSWKELKARMA